MGKGGYSKAGEGVAAGGAIVQLPAVNPELALLSALMHAYMPWPVRGRDRAHTLVEPLSMID